MAKTALYQKYRSVDFDEVIGQDYIVRSIQNAVRTGKTGHAYLFCGPRGTGKTTMARLLAKAVNCEHQEIAPCNHCENCLAANAGTHPDIIEINAANETHVDDIRDLIDRSTLAPMQGKHKVYIIDEVHQLSSAASSALLKTLEEPPENVIFILATTDPQKLLPTIISRCQRYDFTKVRTDLIQNHLLDIAQKENIHMDEEAAEMIAVLADGGMRDSLSIMDQCASYTNDNITADDVKRIYGLTTVSEKIDLIHDLINKDIGSMIQRIQSYEQNGIDLQRFIDGMIDILKDVVIYSSTKDQTLLKALNETEAEELKNDISSSKAMHIAQVMLDAKQKFRTAQNVPSAFEVTCLSIATEEEKAPVIHETAATSIEGAVKPVTKQADDQNVQIIHKEDIRETRKYSEDEILSILVQCTKAEKAKDEPVFSQITNSSDLSEKRYTSLLSSAHIGASGTDCILLITSQQAVANRINDEKTNQELYFFLKGKGLDKMIYSITNEEYQNCTRAFVSRRKNNTLPEPLKVQRYTDQKEEKDEPLQKAKELFGDSLEIIEGE